MPVKWCLKHLLFLLATGPSIAAAAPVRDIPTECSARVFNSASAEFFAPGATQVRLRIMPTYGRHVQIGLAEDPSGVLRVQYLALSEGGIAARKSEGDGCSALALEEKRYAGKRAKFRHLFDQLHSMQIPSKFPSVLYLDDTTYELMISRQGIGTLLSWIGLDEPEMLRIHPLFRWAHDLRKAAHAF